MQTFIHKHLLGFCVCKEKVSVSDGLQDTWARQVHEANDYESLLKV